MKKLCLGFVFLAALAARPVDAATVSLSGPTVVNGAFDVDVVVTGLFDDRTDPLDGLISFGFDVAVSSPVVAFAGATSNASYFDPVQSIPGVDVFAAASGFALLPPGPDPIVLATLHFSKVGNGIFTISVFSDPLSNPFEGLQYLWINDNTLEFFEPLGASLTAEAVPEPATLTLLGAGLAAAYRARRRRS